MKNENETPLDTFFPTENDKRDVSQNGNIASLVLIAFFAFFNVLKD